MEHTPVDLVGVWIADRYEVREEIGRGGMATLYRAWDARHHRDVALKVLRPELTASVASHRFVTEIGVAARLSHPHILGLFDSGDHESRLYYVMAYLEESSVGQIIAGGQRLPVEQAVRLTCEIAEALEYAHERGVVHRDIKPENILLQAGHAVVADFGIALALDRAADKRLTTPGFGIGTASYMSPEQTTGERLLDGRSDIYSLACSLFEMLAGAPPFRSERRDELLEQHRTAPPPSIRAERSDVPAAVDAAIQRALAKDPDARFRTAGEFAAALRSAAPVAPAAPAGRERIRVDKRVVAMGSLAIVATVAALIIITRNTATASRPPLDHELVSVAPFVVASSDPALDHWREDIATTIAGQLDGAGPLRARAALSFRASRPLTDRDSAIVLGRRGLSGFVIMGSVRQDGDHSVRIDAKLVDVGNAQVSSFTIRRTDASSLADHLVSRTIDSLSHLLLGALGNVTRVSAVRRAGAGCQSFSDDVRRRYLEGEQFYRQGVWDSARTAYSDVVAADSTCALSYHRLANVLGWDVSAIDSITLRLELRAGALNHGLTPRDSFMVVVDSLDGALWTLRDRRGTRGVTYWRLARRLQQATEAATRQYPGDPEIWYALGDARHHWGFGPLALSRAEVLAPFDKAIELDSGFAISYLHPIEIAIAMGDTVRARTYMRNYLSHRLGQNVDHDMQIVSRLLDPKEVDSPATSREIATAPVGHLISARVTLDRWPDVGEGSLRITRQIELREFVDSAQALVCGPANDGYEQFAKRLAFRGHAQQAACFLGRGADTAGALVTELLMVGGLSRSAGEAVFDRWMRRDDPSIDFALPWWAAQRDTQRLLALAGRNDSVLAGRRATGDRDRAVRRAGATRAYLSLARGDTTAAIAGLRSLGDSLCVECFGLDRLSLTQLLRARGEFTEARLRANEWQGDLVEVRDILMVLERARIAVGLGDKRTATDDYTYLRIVLADADPSMQPIVAEARTALATLRR